MPARSCAAIRARARAGHRSPPGRCVGQGSRPGFMLAAARSREPASASNVHYKRTSLGARSDHDPASDCGRCRRGRGRLAGLVQGHLFVPGGPHRRRGPGLDPRRRRSARGDVRRGRRRRLRRRACMSLEGDDLDQLYVHPDSLRPGDRIAVRRACQGAPAGRTRPLHVPGERPGACASTSAAGSGRERFGDGRATRSISPTSATSGIPDRASRARPSRGAALPRPSTPAWIAAGRSPASARPAIAATAASARASWSAATVSRHRPARIARTRRRR